MDNPDIDDPFNFHKCKLCGYRTRFLYRILRHVRWHKTRSKNHRFSCHPHSLEKYQCEKCQFQTHLKILLSNHSSTVHKREETRHLNPALKRCTNCNFQTHSSLVWLSHNLAPGKHTSASQVNRQNVTTRVLRPKANHFKALYRETEREDMRRYECDKCPFTSIKNRHLKEHKLYRHTPAEHINCKVKQKPNHLLSHRTEAVSSKKSKRFRCGHCSYKATLKGSLKSHLLHKHTSPEQINWFRCEHCEYKSKRKCDLSQHVLVRHPPTELQTLDRYIRCDRCSYKTMYKANLKSHIRLIHTPAEHIDWYKCEHCSYKTKQKDYLRFHLLSHHTEAVSSKKSKRFRCDHCSYKTTMKSSLKTHLLHRHTSPEQINWFRCELCDYKFKASGNLKQHRISLHTPPEQINWHKCEHCMYKAKLKSNLRKHIFRKHILYSPCAQ